MSDQVFCCFNSKPADPMKRTQKCQILFGSVLGINSELIAARTIQKLWPSSKESYFWNNYNSKLNLSNDEMWLIIHI